MEYETNNWIWDGMYNHPHVFGGLMLTAALLGLSTSYFGGITVPQLPYLWSESGIFHKKKCDKKRIRVYMDGCFDLMHYGHANALRQAKALGDELVVGVVSDEEIIANKGPPVLSMEERLALVSGLKWVDEVIPNAPYEITEQFMGRLFNEHKIDYIIHGDDPCLLPDGTDAYALAKKAGRYKQIKRTEGVSSTDIVGRILASLKETDGKDQNGTSLQKSPESQPKSANLSQFLPTSRRIVQFSNGKMDDKFVDAQKYQAGQEDSLHRVSEERELSGEGTLNSSGSKLKRLVTWSNPQHALVSNVKRSQISKCCIKGSLFQSGISFDCRIPKHILSLDEKFRRKCMELIHISASKVARCNSAVKLSSSKISALHERLHVAEIRSGDTCSSARFVIECPLEAGGGSVVISPSGRWIVGRVMGSKSMTNILKSPLFHQFGPLGGNSDLRRIDCNNDKGSICYDYTNSPGGFSFSSSPMLEKEKPIKGSHKNEFDAGHKRLASICSTNSASSDQSSASALATVSRGMLQCTWKGGNPHFVFSTDEQREVYVANLWKVESEEDKTLDYIYLFHSGKGGQKDHEIRDSESQLVGKMKVNNLVSLCPNNSKIMETEFVLFGGGIEVQASSHNLRKSKGLSKKVVEAFRTTHSSKQRTIPKLSGPCSIIENPSQEPCLDTGNNQDALGVPSLLEDHLPPNFELASIVVKDHLPDDRKEEAGGWGLKFLKKVGNKKISNSVEASVPIKCCCNISDFSTSMDVLVPAGIHSGPRTRNGGPSSLTERWRSGGQCDCGGWDLGCPLTVLKTKSSKEDILPQSDIQEECKSFELNRMGSEHGPPAWRMLNVHDGLYFVHFQPSLSTLQSFAIAVAIIHAQSPAFRPKCTGVLSTKVQGLKIM